jgi:tRNA-2-methylthio-N6-dimethylallyladenosine synthase
MYRKLWLRYEFSDSEIVVFHLALITATILRRFEEADLPLVNTCSIRDKAEQTIGKTVMKYNAV